MANRGNRFNVNIKVKTPDFDRLALVFARAVQEGFKRIGEHAVARAVDNTPIDTSRLRGSIKSKTFKNNREIGVALTADTPYDLHVHENFIPAPGGTIQARLRQTTPEGIVGGEFLTRVANFHIARYRAYLEQVIRDSVRKNKVVTRGRPSS